METTPSLKRLQCLLKFWTALFLVAGIIFIVKGDLLIEMLNKVSESWQPFFVPMPNPEINYWITLTASLMVTLVYMCHKAQDNMRENINFVPAILISKFISTLFFFLYFVIQTRSLANFMGMITDGSIFIVTYMFYKNALKDLHH